MTEVWNQDKYDEALSNRQKYVEDIVNDSAKNKIVVAGPGTGKTFLFQKILAGKDNTLVLTFINALVEDLSKDLFGLTEIKTLHSFARQQLEQVKRQPIQIYPVLSKVIKQDAELLHNRSGNIRIVLTDVLIL